MAAQLQSTEIGYSLSGHLDNQHTPAVYHSIPAANNDTISLDLIGLERIDSAGLALLMLWSNRQNAAGGALQLANIPLQAQQMMAILGLNDIL